MNKTSKYDFKKIDNNIENFCKKLQSKNINQIRTAFFQLEFFLQCLFLEMAGEILREKEKYTKEVVDNGIVLFEAVRQGVSNNIYIDYKNRNNFIDKLYEEAVEWNASRAKKVVFVEPKKPKKSTEKPIPPPKKLLGKTKYTKEYQRYPTPEDSNDSLLLYYKSLFNQKDFSPLAITWLTEHGVDVEDRTALIAEYLKLHNSGKLLK